MTNETDTAALAQKIAEKVRKLLFACSGYQTVGSAWDHEKLAALIASELAPLVASHEAELKELQSKTISAIVRKFEADVQDYMHEYGSVDPDTGSYECGENVSQRIEELEARVNVVRAYAQLGLFDSEKEHCSLRTRAETAELHRDGLKQELDDAYGRAEKAEAENAEPRKDREYNPRKIVTAFLNLPLHKKLETAANLGLIERGDHALDDSEIFKAFFRRATEQNKVAELTAAIDAARSAEATKEGKRATGLIKSAALLEEMMNDQQHEEGAK